MGFSDVDAEDTVIDGYACGGSAELVPLQTPSLLASSPPVSLALLLGHELPPLIISALQPSAGTGRLPQCGRASPQQVSDLVGRSPYIDHERWGTSHRLPLAGKTAWDGISTIPRLLSGLSTTADGGRESEDESSRCDSGGDSCRGESPVATPSFPSSSHRLPRLSAADGRRPRDWPGTAAAVAASLNASLPANLRRPTHSWRRSRPELRNEGAQQEFGDPPPPPMLPDPEMPGRRGRKSSHALEGGRQPSQSPGSPITPLEAVHKRSIADGRAAHPPTAAAVPSSATVATAETVAEEFPLPLPALARPQQRRSPAQAAAAAARASALARFRKKKRRGDFSGATRYVRRAVESTRRARLGGRFVSWAEYKRLTGGGEEEGEKDGNS